MALTIIMTGPMPLLEATVSGREVPTKASVIAIFSEAKMEHGARQVDVPQHCFCTEWGRNWRASQNKTANTYAVEIAMSGEG